MALQPRSKKPLPKRRIEITDSSGWTHVVNGRRNALKTNRLGSQPNALQILDKIPLEQLVADHARCVELWKESACWKKVVNMLQNNVLSTQQIRLTSCVCLGLGSLSTGKQSSKHELAALVSMLRLLGKTHTIEQVIFQDPAFNDVDKAFLTRLGYSVVSTPSGFESIDQNTFCFAPHLEHDVFAMALKNTHPALCIGNSDILADRSLLPSAVDSKNTLEIFRTFVKATTSKMMPEFDRDTWCQFTSIYWLRDDVG